MHRNADLWDDGRRLGAGRLVTEQEDEYPQRFDDDEDDVTTSSCNVDCSSFGVNAY